MTVTTTYTTDGVDGDPGVSGIGNVTWTTMVNHAGTKVQDLTTAHTLGFYSNPGPTTWNDFGRGILVFGNPSIDAGDPIISATLSLYGHTKLATGGTGAKLNIYASAPASETTLVAGDFDSFGTTELSDTGILISGLSTAGFNSWLLNAAGLALVPKDARALLGTRDETYDVPDSAPSGTGQINFRFWAAEEDQSGDRRPKLEITHGVTFTPKVMMF